MHYPLCFNTHFEPFYPPYQDKIATVIAQAQRGHPRTLAIRVKLWLSPESLQMRRRWLAERFIEALRSAITTYSQENNTPESRLNYLWTRDESYPCYHVVLFVNQDTFGDVRGAGILDSLLRQVWDNVQGEYKSADASTFYERVDDIYRLDPGHMDYPEELNRLVWFISDMARDRVHVTSSEARALKSSAW